MMAPNLKCPGSYQIEIIPRQDVLSYKVSGYIRTEDDFRQFIREVTVIIKQSGHRKVLSDARNLKGIRPGVIGAIRVVNEAFSTDLWGKRIAVIERVENIGNMKHREIVALNRGYTLKYFIDPAEAEAWLK